MRELDVTRLSDYALSERYFDKLDRFGEDGPDVENMRAELEGRDLLFKGYLIYNTSIHYTVTGCHQFFTSLEDLKDYIGSRKDIEPDENGSMVYLD